MPIEYEGAKSERVRVTKRREECFEGEGSETSKSEGDENVCPAGAPRHQDGDRPGPVDPDGRGSVGSGADEREKEAENELQLRADELRGRGRAARTQEQRWRRWGWARERQLNVHAAASKSELAAAQYGLRGNRSFVTTDDAACGG